MATRWRCPPESERGRRPRLARVEADELASSRTRARRRSWCQPWCSLSTSSSVASTVWRGSRLEYGSWKTICTSPPRRRRSARCVRVGCERSRPQARIVPAVGRSSPTIILATWSCPSPTPRRWRASRRPGSAESTSSTATSSPKTLRSPSTSRIGSAPAAGATSADHARHRQPAAELLGARTQRTSPPSSSLERGPLLARTRPGRVRAAVDERAGSSGASNAESGPPAGSRASRSAVDVDVGPGGRQRRGVRVQRVAVQQRGACAPPRSDPRTSPPCGRRRRRRARGRG